jgi:NADPH:quinone reductase-like Zn-dependent oxidoreductase
LGAKKVIATGRNLTKLSELKSLGADVTIPLTRPPMDLEAALIEQFRGDGVNIVLDYLWGKSAEAVIVAAARGGKDAVPIRFVRIGSVSGREITLPSAALRSSALVLMGSGIGSIGMDGLIAAVQGVLHAVVPANLQIRMKPISLAEVEKTWNQDSGEYRVVYTIPQHSVLTREP